MKNLLLTIVGTLFATSAWADYVDDVYLQCEGDPITQGQADGSAEGYCEDSFCEPPTSFNHKGLIPITILRLWDSDQYGVFRSVKIESNYSLPTIDWLNNNRDRYVTDKWTKALPRTAEEYFLTVYEVAHAPNNWNISTREVGESYVFETNFLLPNYNNPEVATLNRRDLTLERVSYWGAIKMACTPTVKQWWDPIAERIRSITDEAIKIKPLELPPSDLAI